MATQTIEFTAPTGLTLTCKLFPIGSDTQESSDKSATEATNRKGLYTAQWTDAPAGEYTMHALSSGTVVAIARRKLTAATATFRDSPADVAVAGGTVDGYSLYEALRLILSACVGKLSGAQTATVVFRDAADSKNRITATVDAGSNRTAVTLDAS